MSGVWQDYLQPGEEILWQGAPESGVHGKVKIIVLAIFGLPFLAIGAFAFLAGLAFVFFARDWGDTLRAVFLTTMSLPFAAIGAWMVFGQWYAVRTAHQKIRYALSTRAAYIATSYWKHDLEVYPIRPDQTLELQKGQTTDTVWFHKHEWRDNDGDKRSAHAGFENIADGDKVFQMIRNISQGIKGTSV